MPQDPDDPGRRPLLPVLLAVLALLWTAGAVVGAAPRLPALQGGTQAADFVHGGTGPGTPFILPRDAGPVLLADHGRSPTPLPAPGGSALPPPAGLLAARRLGVQRRRPRLGSRDCPQDPRHTRPAVRAPPAGRGRIAAA